MDTLNLPGLSPQWQAYINLFFLAAVGLGGAYQYFRRPPIARQDPNAVIVGGAFADRQAMERLAAAIESSVPHLERLEQLIDTMERNADERRRDSDDLQRVVKQGCEDIARAIERRNGQ